MKLQQALALILSLSIAGQPVLVHAAGIEHSASGRKQRATAPLARLTSPELQPLFRMLTAGGYRDKAAEQEIAVVLASVVESLPAETIDELAAVAALIAESPEDPAALDEAEQRFQQAIAALPEATRAEIREFASAGLSLSGVAYAFTAILKFKQHKDNPAQTPIGMPISLVFLAAALLFLPSILGDGAADSDQCRLCSDVCPAPAGAE